MTREPRAPSWGNSTLVALGLALPALVFTWGFTVDDALVAARVAHQWSLGRGYVFNPSGPPVDAVTPLGWAALLVPFAKHGTWAALEAARWIGVVAWLGAVWVTVRLVLGSGTARTRYLSLALLGIATPPAAWASSGMETGVASLSFTYMRDPFALSFTNRYTDKTQIIRNWNYKGTSTRWDAYDNTVESEIITDAQVNYRFDLARGNLNLFLNVNNVFDRDPQPYLAGNAGVADNNSFYGQGPGLGVTGDLRGRRFVVGLRFEFK